MCKVTHYSYCRHVIVQKFTCKKACKLLNIVVFQGT